MTFRVCLPLAPALRQVLEAMLAEGALDSPSILVLAFHSSLFLVEGSSDGLAAGDRFLSLGRLCLAHSVRVELSRFCAVSLWWVGFSCSSGPDGGLLSDPVTPFLEETIEVPVWVGSSSSLSGLSTVDFFPVFPRVFSPGVVMAPPHGFRLRPSGCFWVLGAGSRPVVPLRSLASSHSGVLCDASWGPSLFPHFLRRSLASCLAALPFASLPLVSRPWTVLSWSHLMSLSSVSDRFVVVPRQLVGLGGCSPASPNCSPSRVKKQRSFGFSASLSLRVFAMRSPFRVESVSVLDRNDGSYYTFLVFGRSLRDEVTLTGRVFLRSRSERRLFEHLP